MNYAEFIQSKKPVAQLTGFIPKSKPHNSLFGHQKDLALWMVRGGRRACFAAFGLGKTRIHLQVAKWVIEKDGSRKYLIIAPLGVRQEFTKVEGPAMGLKITYCRTDAEVEAAKTQIIITNYERVRDGGINVTPDKFSGVGLDEASVLRSFGSKTYQSFLAMFSKIDYRFVFTATPSPNRHKELIHYGGFLGVMDTGQALTRFFQRDSQKAGNLTLMPSMEEEFWDWLASWACFMQKPSDLGYSDKGYKLPPMNVEWISVPVDHTAAWKMIDSWGQHQLFLDKSSGLKELAEVKRDTIVARLAKAKEIIESRPGENFILWHDLEEERRLIEKTIPGVKTTFGNQDLELREEIILEFSTKGFPVLATKPILAGSGCNLQKHCHNAIFLGSSYKFNDVIQAAHRIQRFQQKHQVNLWFIFSESEEPVISSLKTKWAQHDTLVKKMSELLKKYKLDLNTMQIIRKTGCERLEIESENFRAINNDCILELLPRKFDTKHNVLSNGTNENGSTKEMGEGKPKTSKGIQSKVQREKQGEGATMAKGVVSQEQKEGDCQDDSMAEEKSRKEKTAIPEVCVAAQSEDCGKNKSLVSKEQAKIEKRCNDKKSKKAIRCDAGDVQKNVDGAKEQMRDLQNEVQKDTGARSLSQNKKAERGSVREVQLGTGELSGQSKKNDSGGDVSGSDAWEDNCVDLIVTSIPFGNLYEYSPNYSDLGQNEDNKKFFEQMDFLVPNLLRVLKPGRLACIHVKDRIRFGAQHGTGVPTVDRFSDKTADCFEKHGFFFLGRITIDTDVVRENAQTYRLGWSENSKDSTKMGVGMPEYVLIFRKPHSDLSAAYADLPVTKDKSIYMRAHWQVDASSFWKSDGNRLPDPDIIANMPMDAVRRLWIDHCHKNNYSWKEHVELAAKLEDKGYLPSSWMLFSPISNHPGIWTDITRMRVLNSEQEKRNEDKHVCPLQLDIVNRLINRYSNRGEIVLDPFAGIFTVPYCALHLGRKGWGIELAKEYWRCGVGYCEQAERERHMPTLFDLPESIKK